MNSPRLTFALLALLLCGCSARHSAISSTYDFSKLKRVAVAGIDSGSSGISGVDDMVTRALMEKGFSVVERAELDKIIAEQKIGAQGYISASTARELGNILGVDGFMMGSIASYTPEKQDVAMIEAASVQINSGGVPPQGGHGGRGRPGGQPPAQQSPTITTTIKRIPHVYTKYAQATLTMRMVDTQTGEVTWAGSYTTEGISGSEAVEYAANYLVDTFYDDMQKKIKETGKTAVRPEK
ncbi:MAG: hypothetical protein GX410_02105 [Elusimicrobia bacterium]|nr:hypothetical protein [Elusimicrobiota bacterium]